MKGLPGKVAIITGAQQGIGEAIVLALAEVGAHVIVNYLDDANAAADVTTRARAFGVIAEAVQGDVSNSTDIEQLMLAADAIGGVDILINNAGIFPRANFLELSESLYDSVLGVNLKGAVFCTQAAARRMVATGSPGSVINLSSNSAFRPSPRGVHYASSKAGLPHRRGASLAV